MVSVNTNLPANAEVENIDLDGWLNSIAGGRPAGQLQVIRRAVALADRAHEGQMRTSGESYLLHCLTVADILAKLRMDYETIAAAVLHDVIKKTPLTMGELEIEFGPNISHLVDGVTRMGIVEGAQERNIQERVPSADAESLRKMLLAMAQDVRMVLIKLADRLHNMRTLHYLPAEQGRRIARETMDIYAPLANRLDNEKPDPLVPT